MPISRRSSGVQPLLGRPEGLTISRNNSQPNTRLDIGSGRAVIQAANGLRHIAINPSTFTKRLDAAWTPGSGNGGRLTASIENNATYHVFLLRNDATGAIDFGLDTSVSGANRPAGWSSRIIGSWLTDGSGNLRNIIQVGDRFFHAAAVAEINFVSNFTTNSSNLQALTVPTGLRLEADVVGYITHPSDPFAVLTIEPPDISTAPVIGYLSPNLYSRGALSVLTNAIRQVRVYAGVANSTVALFTTGWTHPRGA